MVTEHVIRLTVVSNSFREGSLKYELTVYFKFFDAHNVNKQIKMVFFEGVFVLKGKIKSISEFFISIKSTNITLQTIVRLFIFSMASKLNQYIFCSFFKFSNLSYNFWYTLWLNAKKKENQQNIMNFPCLHDSVSHSWIEISSISWW